MALAEDGYRAIEIAAAIRRSAEIRGRIDLAARI